MSSISVDDESDIPSSCASLFSAFSSGKGGAFQNAVHQSGCDQSICQFAGGDGFSVGFGKTGWISLSADCSPEGGFSFGGLSSVISSFFIGIGYQGVFQKDIHPLSCQLGGEDGFSIGLGDKTGWTTLSADCLPEGGFSSGVLSNVIPSSLNDGGVPSHSGCSLDGGFGSCSCSEMIFSLTGGAGVAVVVSQ